MYPGLGTILQKIISRCLKSPKKSNKVGAMVEEVSLRNLARNPSGNSVGQRRIRGDLIETFKIMKELHKTDREKFFYVSNSEKTRGHNLKLFKLSLKKGFTHS